LHRYLVVALFYGSLYFALQTGTDPNYYSNRLSLFFFSLIFNIVEYEEVIVELQQDRLIFYRERGARAYGAFSYWISFIYLKPFIIFVNVFTYSLVLYYMAGLRSTSEAFGFFVFVLYISSLIAFSVYQIFSGISPSSQVGVSLSAIFVFLTFSFAGFAVYLPRFPIWLGNWGPPICLMRFSFQALTLNEFDHNDSLPYEASYVENLGFNTLSKEDCAVFLVLFLIAYALLAFLPLKYLSFEKR
jgi:ABC-type multidrug transport system permease subunit